MYVSSPKTIVSEDVDKVVVEPEPEPTRAPSTYKSIRPLSKVTATWFQVFKVSALGTLVFVDPTINLNARPLLLLS